MAFLPAIELCGFDVPGYEVKNVRFKDVVLEDNNGPAQSIQMQNCQNVSLENITVQAGHTAGIKERSSSYEHFSAEL